MNQDFSFIKKLKEKNKKRKVHFFKWDQKYYVKNKVIDEQHRKLFCLQTNYIFFRLKNKKRTFKKILIELIRYYKYHFASEERLFEIKRHEFLEQHKKIINISYKKLATFIIILLKVRKFIFQNL